MGTGSTAPRAGQRLLRSGRWLRAVADIGAMSSGCAVLLAARRHPRDFARHHRTGIGPEMTDEQRMLADMAGALFGAYGEANATIADWHEIEASGMTTLMVPEAAGGFGGGWRDGAVLCRRVGHAAAVRPTRHGTLA